MLLQLDDTLRGIVIGRQGATIKETQRVTGAMLTLPKRGETGPVRVSGPTAQTVMHAARLVARQSAAQQAEIACTCSVAGSDIAATLRDSHILFEGAGFVAFCLPASACPPADELDVLLDDTAFALGAGADLAWAASAGDDTFVYGLGAGEPVARAVYAKLASATAAAAEAQAAAVGGGSRLAGVPGRGRRTKDRGIRNPAAGGSRPSAPAPRGWRRAAGGRRW